MARWFENFEGRHGVTAYSIGDGALRAVAEDGSTAAARLPFGRPYDGPPDVGAYAAATVPPASWGVLLVRKGGFAVARVAGPVIAEHKVGRRHVQGRSRAGGQSQLRFARRRDHQARAAYDAAADHAVRILTGHPIAVLVTGGDRPAVDAVLADPRLAEVARRCAGPWLPVADPRRDVLDRAVTDAGSVVIEVANA